MKNEILSFNIIYKKIKVDNIQNYQPLFFLKKYKSTKSLYVNCNLNSSDDLRYNLLNIIKFSHTCYHII